MIRLLLACLASLLLLGSAMAQSLPPVPAAIRDQGVLRVGVRCDQPPYGYQDQGGAFAGVEVDMAKQIAAWIFGDPAKIEITCVTAENRIPQLIARKVDVLLATLGITAERARVIDFTQGYNWGGGDVLVFMDAPIKSMADLKGKMIASLKGSTQVAWFEAKMPDVEVLRLNSVSDALQALKQRRVVGVGVDKATIMVVASRDPEMRLLGAPYAVTEGGIGVRKNEADWLAYLNACIERMRAEKLFIPWIEKVVPVTGNRELYITAFITKPQLGD